MQPCLHTHMKSPHASIGWAPCQGLALILEPPPRVVEDSAWERDCMCIQQSKAAQVAGWACLGAPLGSHALCKSVWMYPRLAETNRRPISQTPWLMVTPHCSQCHHWEDMLHLLLQLSCPCRQVHQAMIEAGFEIDSFENCHAMHTETLVSKADPPFLWH
eukprot:1136438-Pelagomonas_calceolata.AAC.2